MHFFYRGKLLPFRKKIRAFEPGFLPEFYWQASTGKLIERQMWLFPFWLNLQNKIRRTIPKITTFACLGSTARCRFCTSG